MTHKEGSRAKKLIDQAVHTPQETTELLRYIAHNMVTREDLEINNEELSKKIKEEIKGEIRMEIKASEQRVMDHTTRECAKIRGDLVVLIRKEDEKVDEFVRVVATNDGISSADRLRIERLGPFPKLA